jgi:hypothetical protein
MQTTNSQLPTEAQMFDIIARLHTETPQQKYQYSNRVLTYARIGMDEMRDALRVDPDVTEAQVWRDMKAREVSDRLAGRLTDIADEHGFRERWHSAGLSEGSWTLILNTYCNLKPLDIPISHEDHLRANEEANFVTLLGIFDQEIFGHLSDPEDGMKNVVKSKWWKECHRVFHASMAVVVRDRMDLDNSPKNLCYALEWNSAVIKRLTTGARRIRESNIWDERDIETVDFTANNERVVKKYLTKYGITEAALSRDD